jgi:hypothetical protein
MVEVEENREYTAVRELPSPTTAAQPQYSTLYYWLRPQSHEATLTNTAYNTSVAGRDHVRKTLHLSQLLLTNLKYRQWILTGTCVIIMEIDPTSPVGSQAYTILRIKRKRYEEPLDALGKPCPCRPSSLRE